MVGGASGHDSAIVDVRGEGFEAPFLHESQQGEDVDGGKYGGKRGALGGAMVKDHFREWFSIKQQCNLAIREERPNPVTQGGGKAQQPEDVDKVTDMEVVKEALDVE